MKSCKKKGSLILILFTLFACEKDPNPKHFTGIYRGIFTRVVNSTDTTGSGVVFLAITTESMSFQLAGDTLSLTPASSGGTYSLPNEGEILFENTAIIGVPVYDRFYVLDTLYTYEFDDPMLNIRLTFDTLQYHYNLLRY